MAIILISTYSFHVAFDPAFELVLYAVAANVHPCDRYLVAMVSVVNALFAVVNVHQVSYENEVQVQQMMVRHYRNVARHRLSEIPIEIVLYRRFIARKIR